jgi:DNA-binding SARP family transcriptional activator
MRTGRTGGGRVTLRLLDGFELVADGRTVTIPRAARRALSFLALADRPLERDRVAGALWLESSERVALANLRNTLWRLDRLVHGLVLVNAVTVSLAPRVAVDVRDLVLLALAIISDQVPIDESLAERLVTSRELLPGWSDEWVVPVRERFRQLRLHALERLSDQLAAEGKYGLAIEAGLAAVADDPYRETARKVLIGAYLAEGNKIQAIRELERYRRIVADELGVEPSIRLELTDNEEVILRP